jgi:CHASE2 domain-containing sensor protein
MTKPLRAQIALWVALSSALLLGLLVFFTDFDYVPPLIPIGLMLLVFGGLVYEDRFK